jgi:addiction module HigA family antidote
MAEYPALRDPKRCPSHPGALLREIIDANRLNRSEIARGLGLSRQQIYGILGEQKPVSPEVAVRLGKYFGNGAGLWLRMQTAYDLWHAEREVDTSKIGTLERQSA